MLALRHAAKSSLQRTLISSATQASAVTGGSGGGSIPNKGTFYHESVALPNHYHSCFVATAILPIGNNSIVHSCSTVVPAPSSLAERVLEVLEEGALWMVSTLKRRNRKMNKHKLRKRRKKNRKKTRKI